MAGYNGYSKSNNAIQAEQSGYYPATILAKKLGVKAKAITELMSPSEWHHTSSHYNRTNYYSMEEAEEIIEELKSYKIEKPSQVSYQANVEYLTWSGTRNHPKATEHKFKNIEVIEKGCYYTFNTPEGEVKKKIGSNGTYVTKIIE